MGRDSSREGVGAGEGRAEAAGAVRVLYMLWGAIGLSILVEFGVLLFLQREGSVSIATGAGGLAPGLHVAAACALFGTAAVAVGVVRSRLRDPERLARGARGAAQRVVSRFLALHVIAWAVAEALAIVGFAFALALPPVPRLALSIYFTGALFLWLLGRPATGALEEARRRAAAGA